MKKINRKMKEKNSFLCQHKKEKKKNKKTNNKKDAI
jgi:hypothetical protein